MPKKPASETAKPDEPPTEVSVEYLGNTYTIPRDRDDWPWIAHELFGEQKYAEGIRALIGDKQWGRLYRDGALTRREYRDFANLLAEAAQRECVG